MVLRDLVMLTEEDLIEEIMKRKSGLSREELLRMVDERLARNPFLTRAGALLIILEEERLWESLTPRDFSVTEIANLTPGLRNIRLFGRLLGFRRSSLKGGRTLTIFRIGDRTGTVCALLWGDAGDDLRPGEVLGLSGFQASIDKLTGILELVGGDGAKVERGGVDPEPPPLRTFFKTPSQVGMGDGALYDIVCVVLFNCGIEMIRRGDFARTIARLVVGDESGSYPLTLWGDLSSMVSGLGTGDTVLITSLKRDGDGFSSTNRTTIHRINGEGWTSPQAALERIKGGKRLKILYADDRITICTDGTRLLRLGVKAEFKVGECLNAIDTVTVNWNGIPHIYFRDVEPLQAGDYEDIPEPRIQLESISDLRRDILFEGSLARKGPTSIAATRYGDMRVLSLWIKVDDRIYPATVWGEKTRELEPVPEGSRLRILMAAVRRDRFGGVEIVVDEDTALIVENGFK
jgi:hypothetical protein